MKRVHRPVSSLQPLCRAYRITPLEHSLFKKQGDLRLYGSTIDAHTLEVLYSKPIVEGVDFKYTWHGVRGLGSMWFKFKKPSETSHTAAAAIDTTTGKSFGVSLNAFVQDTGKLRNVVRLA